MIYHYIVLSIALMELKAFYVDHSTKTTTFIDPRLPTEQPPLVIVPQMPLPQRYRDREGDSSTADFADLVPTGACTKLYSLYYWLSALYSDILALYNIYSIYGVAFWCIIYSVDRC